MSEDRRTVRVFISSTFRDMHAERDHLVTVVFPELRERVEALGLGFFDVDLRWGVPEKTPDGEKANSWEYCRQWIDRVEPFFVCIFGQRYGWVPEANHFRDADEYRRQERDPRSITELEVRHAVLDGHRKRRSYFYLRETPVPEPREDASEEDLRIHSDFVDPEPEAENLATLKDEVRKCGRPVRDYRCRWTGREFANLDAFGRMVLEDLWSGVLRDERYVSKDLWRRALGCDPDRDPRYTDEMAPVPDDISAKIVMLAKPPPQDPLDAEREQMQTFAASRLRWFQGRTRELQQLVDFAASTDDFAPRLAVVAAIPGQGKSALLAKLWWDLVPFKEGGSHSELRPPPSTLVLSHFVGTTERSTSAHALVERLLGELDRSAIAWPAEEQAGHEPKRDFKSLCLRLAQRLGGYAGKRRIVILLDALNQLSDGHDLNWLPLRFGPSVRVVVSCIESPSEHARFSLPDSELKEDLTPEQRVLHALVSRQPPPLLVPLGPLRANDVGMIVVAYLNEYCHELDREHLNTLCTFEQVRNPLYLRVMLNELRTLGGNDLNRIVPALIASMPLDHPDTVSLFHWVLQRLEVFGPEAVRWWCLFLAHGRVGMASHELADLLAQKLGADAAATAFRIERGLRRYLQRRGPQLDFFHGQLRQAAIERYSPQAVEADVHRDMAEHFTANAKGSDPKKEWETNSVRGFAECVFHRTRAGEYDLAAGLLSNFPFLLHKLRVGPLEGVFEDYDIVSFEAPPEEVKRLGSWIDFFHEYAHIFRRGNEDWPAHKILLQLAVEHADASPITIGAEQWLTEGRCDWLWLRRVPRPPHARKSPCLAVLEGHTSSWGIGALELADGRLLSWAGDTLLLWDGHSGACVMALQGHSRDGDGIKSALELSDGRLLSWAGDSTLRLWDGHRGVCVATLEGHSGWVCGALELSHGQLLSWASDHTLRLWDGHSGACVAILEGHTEWIWGALELSDGRLLSWASDHTLRLWNNDSGACIAVLKGHGEEVKGALELSDGHLLSWAEDCPLRLWDGHDGRCLLVLEGHTKKVGGALELSDGRVLSWADDRTLRLWDSHNGRCLTVLEGHTNRFGGALALSDGRVLSWADSFWDDVGSKDNTLCSWDGNSGECLAVLEGHTDGIKGALVLGDGRLLSWASDHTLRLWDHHSGGCAPSLEGHPDRVSGALELSDGQLLSWAFNDNALRLWDSRSGECLKILEGHRDGVIGALQLAGGGLLSWAKDHTLRLWNGHDGRCLTVLKGQTNRVAGTLELSGERLLSWADDRTLRLWNGHDGACLKILEGHGDEVSGALELTGGRLISWAGRHGFDHTLRLWDSLSGECLAVLESHTFGVFNALEIAGGRVLSWTGRLIPFVSPDQTLRSWDPRSGECLSVFEGHTDGVSGAVELADGR
ncbi:MAG: DUF4062 domain-containing protein, partial [Gemmatimonadota bacterium]